jgi:hypothetical protein
MHFDFALVAPSSSVRHRPLLPLWLRLLNFLPLTAVVYLLAASHNIFTPSQRTTYIPQNTPSLAATMATSYSSSELRDIGTRNSSRLPPASAIVGMYEYELRRNAEPEKLFDDTVIQAAKAAKEVYNQQFRLCSLEDAIKSCVSHHKNEHTVSISGSTHMILVCSLVCPITSSVTLTQSSPTHSLYWTIVTSQANQRSQIHRGRPQVFLTHRLRP